MSDARESGDPAGDGRTDRSKIHRSAVPGDCGTSLRKVCGLRLSVERNRRQTVGRAPVCSQRLQQLQEKISKKNDLALPLKNFTIIIRAFHIQHLNLLVRFKFIKLDYYR